MNKSKLIMDGQPFVSVTKGIVNVKPIKDEHATTGNAFQVRGGNGRQYKLSFYDTEEKARRVEEHIKHVLHLLPKFYGREGSMLLFDWVEGKHLFELDGDLETLYKLGVIYGEFHQLNKIHEEAKKAKRVANYISRLEGLVPDHLYQKAKAELNKFEHKLHDDLVLEMN